MKNIKVSAKDIVNLLKYNDNLTDDQKILAVELRLVELVEKEKLISDQNKILTSDYSSILPPESLKIPEFYN